MLGRIASALLPLAAALAVAPAAAASGGHYTFAGGTASERHQVVAALQASAFPWDVVPQTIVVRIGHGLVSEAAPGEIVLDADLLDAGRVSWGVVQHEYAHEVDFLVLDGAQRGELESLLGATSWWAPLGVAHGDSAAERFASTVAWAYWEAPANALEPRSRDDEAGHVAPAAFRSALAAMLPGLRGAVAERLRTATARHGHTG